MAPRSAGVGSLRGVASVDHASLGAWPDGGVVRGAGRPRGRAVGGWDSEIL